MEDLLQSQIQDSCRLALPSGLKELMSDISREVLRAHPHDLMKFITDYLSTLLITRENLSVAARVCSNICDCSVRLELYDELRSIGLDEDNASNAKDIIEEFFGKGEVKEGNLLLKLMRKTNIYEEQLPEVVAAIRRSFLTHQRNLTQIYEISSNSDEKETEKAAKHTLGLYGETNPSYETYNFMARKIQASYRAYRERRHTQKRSSDSKTTSNAEDLEKFVTFRTFDKPKGSIGSIHHHVDNKENFKPTKMVGAQSQKPMVFKISSISLAGSHLSLPKYIPYSVHEFGHLMELEETETERSNFDYTRENKSVDKKIDMPKKNGEKKDKKILFYELPTDEEDSAEEVDDEQTGEFSVKEGIVNHVIGEEGIVEEDIAHEGIVEGEIGGGTVEERIEKEVIEEIDEDVAEVIVKGSSVDDHKNDTNGESKVEDLIDKTIVGDGIVEEDIVGEDVLEYDIMW